MKKTLQAFYVKHAAAKQALLSWLDETEKSIWETPNDIIANYPSADIINRKRVVFNIKGNNFRLVVDVEYNYKKVFVVWLGTHAEYDKIDVKIIRYVKNY